MNSSISIGRFRSEIESCNRFLLTYEDPLTPLNFSVLFDHIAVNISASPYIALKNSEAKLCLSHIESIKRYCGADAKKGFMLVCKDYSASDIPVQSRFFLKCY